MKKRCTQLFACILKTKTGKVTSRNLSFHDFFNSNPYPFMNSKFTFLSGRLFLVFILCSVSLIELRAQISNKTIFPLNEYVTTEKGSPYPVLVQSKLDNIDISKFVSVLDYGAKGDGETWDDEAIEKAFNAAQYGVIFPANKTYLVHKLTTIHLKGNMTVYAYGATIKMDDFSRYSFLSLEYESGSYNNTVIWLGGRLYGNKKKQSWPGSPTGNSTWEEDHGRFLGISYASFALVKDVNVTGTVMDGVGFESCKLAVMADSKASGGAPIKYSDVSDQGTYFKCTRSGSQAFYCMNLNCDGGSIGVHYSTSSVEDNSLSVVTNCQFNNQTQDALHFEDCLKVFMYNCTVKCSINGGYTADVHLSNRVQTASIKSCQFTNARVDFNNASDLQIGVVDDCQFVSEYKGGESSSLLTCLAGATHCINSSFKGKTNIEQAWADNVQNCNFSEFDDLALRGPFVTNSSVFENGPTPISPAKNGVVVNCTFDNVDKSTYRKPDDSDWEKPFLSVINIYDDNNTYLGQITCGSNSADLQNKIVSNSFSSTMKKSITDSNMNVLPNQKMLVYPNPTVNELHITLNEKISGKTMLNIYDQQGRLVQTKTIYKNISILSESFNVRNLASGSYVLQIVSGIEKASFKFVVSK